MKEQHPIDELFARLLRDAEAVPPARVWQGIVQNRKRAGWLRRWGWLPLVLLFSTGIGYSLMELRAPAGAATASAHGHGATIAPYGAPPAPAEGSDATMRPHAAEPSALVPVAPREKRNAQAAARMRPASNAAHASPAERAPAAHGIDVATDRNPAKAVAEKAVAAVAHGHGHYEREERVSAPAGHAGTGPLGVRTSTKAETVRGPGGAYWLRTRLPQVGGEPAEPDLLSAPSTSFAGPHRSWWIAATAGQFSETRTWKGGSTDLRTALQGTEQPHHTSAFGLLFGINGRGGWSLATGLEHHAGRYDFKHADRFRTRRDSIITHVVTFNTLILASSTDTISTYREEQRSVAAVNRYTTLRIPVELGWHVPHRRFRLGARAGLALEISTLRSGATLQYNELGLQSVEVTPTDKQCMSVLAASVGADLGYILTEHWSIWASPVYEAGLLSLLPEDHAPCSMPERMGIRFRLAYTIRP